MAIKAPTGKPNIYWIEDKIGPRIVLEVDSYKMQSAALGVPKSKKVEEGWTCILLDRLQRIKEGKIPEGTYQLGEKHYQVAGML